jgi:hypothetical protein
VPDRRGQPELGRAERRPGPQRDLAGGDVLTGVPQVGAGRGGAGDGDDVGGGVGLLHRDDDVGPGGQRGAGHDPVHRARLQDRHVGATGRDVGGHRQPDRRPRARRADLGPAGGVPVHRRVAETGEGDPGGEVLGQHPPRGRGDRHVLDRQQPEEPGHHRLVFLDRAHAPILTDARGGEHAG